MYRVIFITDDLAVGHKDFDSYYSAREAEVMYTEAGFTTSLIEL